MSQNKKKNTYVSSKGKQNNSSVWIFGITMTVAIIAVITLIVFGAKQGNNNQPPSTVSSGTMNFNYTDRPMLGKESAKISIAEFADFKCPACKAWEDKIFPQLKKDFIDTGKAKLYFFDFQVIQPYEDSQRAFNAGHSLYKQSPDAFWQYYEKIYAQQGDERKAWASNDYLAKFVKENVQGVNIDQFEKDLNAGTYNNLTVSSIELANKMGVHSTPTLFINGVHIANAFDYAEIVAAIEKG